MDKKGKTLHPMTEKKIEFHQSKMRSSKYPDEKERCNVTTMIETNSIKAKHPYSQMKKKKDIAIYA